MSLDLDVAAEPQGRRYAIVIGISHYDNFDYLAGAENDAMELHALLKNDMGYDEVYMLTNSDNAHSVEERLEKICNKVGENDTILFYFSGHGLMSERKNNLHMIVTNTNEETILASSISGNRINELMASTNSKKQLMFLDCCNAGAFARSINSYSLSGGRIIIASSSESGPAFETLGKNGQMGVFSRELVEGIRSGRADLNGDGKITVLELYQYCRIVVSEKGSRQEPMLWSLGLSEDFVIAERETTKMIAMGSTRVHN